MFSLHIPYTCDFDRGWRGSPGGRVNQAVMLACGKRKINEVSFSLAEYSEEFLVDGQIVHKACLTGGGEGEGCFWVRRKVDGYCIIKKLTIFRFFGYRF